jgi:hypothetical protein
MQGVPVLKSNTKSPVTAILEIARGTSCSFFNVKVLDELSEPTVVLLKVWELGLKLTGKMLRPCNATLWGELPALSVTVNVLVFVPTTVGA